MPADKSANNVNIANNAHVYPGPRPLMPTLSSNNRPGRPPLTPRIAGSVVSTTPPTIRRGVQNDPVVTPKSALKEKEDLSTPVKSFLNLNVTPRSSSRKARAGSAGSTPNGTPTATANHSRAPSAVNTTPTLNDSPIIVAGDRRPAALAIDGVSPTLTNNHRSFHTDGPSQPTEPSGRPSPNFFYASDANNLPNAPRGPQTRAAPLAKASTFFYANGEDLAKPKRPELARNASTDVSQGGSRSTLSHHGSPYTSSAGATPIHSPTSASERPVATQKFPPLASHASPVYHHRPQSPVKDTQIRAISPQRGTPPAVATRAAQPSSYAKGPVLSPQLTPNIGVPRPASPIKRSSTELSSPPIGHMRTSSAGSCESTPSARKNFHADLPGPPLPEILLGVLEGIKSGDISVKDPHTLSTSPENAGIASPEEKPVPSSLQKMNELAANARRERKVLDLEISNSSLMAINRTLEREMRKQTAELRRFRRLSRSGRISIASSTRKSDARMSHLSVDGETMSQMSDLTEEDESEQDDEEEEEDDSDSLSEEDSNDDTSQLSPSALEASDARHRAKDERRLKLDLSKHQQLLLDSQKMNQSLKRCLGWTESLIAEGKKALDYHVRVSEVELGGRVLPPPLEDDADAEPEPEPEPEPDEEPAPARPSYGAHPLGDIENEIEIDLPSARVSGVSDATGPPIDLSRRYARRASPWESEAEREDRDSGVELERGEAGRL